MNKINVLVIFGGKSGEHDVSISSAFSILSNIDREKYNILTVGITKSGEWLYFDKDIDNIKNGSWEELSNKNVEINLIKNGNREVGIKFEDGTIKKIDVIFPVLHGPYGEDGTIQGLFELSEIPYVGCKVLASSVGMDKLICKNLFSQMGLSQVDYTFTTKIDFENNKDLEISKIEKKLNYPIFVKPANMGSSVGISKVKNKEELVDGINEALKYDTRIVLEKGIDAREIEVSVLGNNCIEASICGEIKPAKEFYTYEDKYLDGKSTCEIPANIDDLTMEKIRSMAIKAFRGIDGKGLARVDFFIDKKDGEIYINEINTLPGFTDISMYPKMWEYSGIKYKDLISKLIDLAFDAKR